MPKAIPKKWPHKSLRRELLYQIQSMTEVMEKIVSGEKVSPRAVVEEAYNGRACLERFGVTKEKPLEL